MSTSLLFFFVRLLLPGGLAVDSARRRRLEAPIRGIERLEHGSVP